MMSPDVTRGHQPWGATACGFARHGSRDFRSSTPVWGDGVEGKQLATDVLFFFPLGIFTIMAGQPTPMINKPG